jgi:exodeoxyribonuclease VII small subunit
MSEQTTITDADTTATAGGGADAAQPVVELSFEQGYDRLQEIARRLADEQVSVSEMCELFAEGRGLELALTEFLDSERARVEAIERGEGIRAFRISRATASRPARRPSGEPAPLPQEPGF